MNVLRRFIPRLTSVNVCSVLPARPINYTTTALPEIPEEYKDPEKKQRWLSYNDKIFPPQAPGEERRPAYVCHSKLNFKYSPKKMWYIACFVRGMTVDEALKQLDFVKKKGALIAKETILEAQQLAVENHNVEFKTNLWVAESFVGKGHVVKGLRRHAKARIGRVEYKYCHYYVRLEEGKPPADYYNRPSTDKESLLNKWLDQMRSRKVVSSL